MATNFDNNSYDLIWETIRHNNAFLVKRNQAGGVQFSKDPLNLTNLHSRKYSSLANPQAIGINSKDGNIEVITKLGNNSSKPAKSYSKTTFKSTTPSRKLINNAVSGNTKRGYRQDLHMEAVQRASAVKKATRQVKASVQPTKLRGSKARKAAEKQ
ncbi:ribosomal protein L28e [Aureobasidium subglaciale]|nr:ribosomal protein L28e [Aureobasidium subglaciale]